MKVLFEIDDDKYEDIKNGYICQEYADEIIKSVAEKSIAIVDDFTNGDVIKALFDEEDIWDLQTALNCHSETIGWWHMSYQKDVVDKQSETCDNCRYYPNGGAL